MSDLKPCPFCGGECDQHGWMDINANQGPECECCGATAGNENCWNNRPLESAKDARIAELEEMIRRFVPSNDYEGVDEDGEWECRNYGGDFEYNDDSESIGLDVIKLLAKDGE